MINFPIRRAPKRLLGNAPAEVYDIFDNGGKTFDRYAVFFGPTRACTNFTGQPLISGLWMSEDQSPRGVNTWYPISIPAFRDYRRDNRRYRVPWEKLPKLIRGAVIEELTDTEESDPA